MSPRYRAETHQARIIDGLGLRHLRIGGEDLYRHTGTIPGYSMVAMHHDSPEYTIAVLSNVSTID